LVFTHLNVHFIGHFDSISTSWRRVVITSLRRIRKGVQKHVKKAHRIFLLAAVAGIAGWAQTQVNLQTQSKNIDFSAAPSTKPFKLGAALPASCNVGEAFFKTSAAPGANWYGCVATNVWVAQAGAGGGGGGASSSTQLTDFQTTATSGTTLTVAPGVYRVGSISYSYPASTTFTLTQYTIASVNQAGQATVTLASNPGNSSIHFGDTIYISGATGSGCSGMNALQTIVNLPAPNQVTINWNSTGCTYTANSAKFGANPGATGTGYIYGDYSGNLTLEMPAAAGLIAIGAGTITPITIQNSTPGFDPEGVPIASVAIASTGNGAWGMVTDARAFMSATSLVAGAGMNLNQAGGVWTVGIDPSIVPELGAGNTWTGANDFSAASSTAPLKVSANAPATCSVGQYYFNRSSAHTYACISANTWGQVDGGGGGGGATITTETYDLPVGTCDYGGTGHSLWWVTPNTAQASCEASSVSTIVFGAAGNATGRAHMIVPIGWSGGQVNLYLYGANVSGGSASTYSVQTQCYSPSAGSVPGSPGSYNAAQALTTAPNSSTGYFTNSLSGLTMMGCSAGNIIDILLTKTSTNVADHVYGAYLTIVRSL
jgi:hypothetical protein